MDVVPETLFEEILTSVPSDEATIDQFLCYISYLLKEGLNGVVAFTVIG